jgi:hypothetical protein
MHRCTAMPNSLLATGATVWEKLFHKAFVAFHRIDRCHYRRALDRARPLVFYLDYPKFIHFGDTLWFEPLARLFAASGFDVRICCNPPMEFYFWRLGYRVVRREDVARGDTLLARTELAHRLRGRDVFWTRFDFKQLDAPLIDTVLQHAAARLGRGAATVDPCPRPVCYTPEERRAAMARLGLSEGLEYSVLNNYVDSRKWSARGQDFRRCGRLLLECAGRVCGGTKVIHTGTAQDKAADPEAYPVVDLDLRGSTTLEDAFVLASLPNVRHYVGYDTLWVHLFNLYGKPSYVQPKPGFSAAYTEKVKRFVGIPYSGAGHSLVFVDEEVIRAG